MKKYIAILFAAILAVISLCACGSSGTATQNTVQNTAQNTTNNTADSADRIQIVATIFPEYDWVQQIMGEEAENADITLLLDNGVDMHSFQPTVDDMLKISNADFFLYVGGESEAWVEDALRNANNKDMKVINLMEVLGDAVKVEEYVEGMQHDHDHEDADGHEDDHDHDHEEEADHDHDHDHEEEEEAELDEHVWLSLENAKIFSSEIAAVLSEIDAEHADTYNQNLQNYIAELDSLDAEYKNIIEQASQNTILLGDRFPFRYLVDDYGLEYYAAFAGCEAETEASFNTIIFLAEKLDELNLNTVFILERSDDKIARTVIDNTKNKDQQVKVLDSMQATTTQDMAEGASYLSIMESNLNAIKDAIY